MNNIQYSRTNIIGFHKYWDLWVILLELLLKFIIGYALFFLLYDIIKDQINTQMPSLTSVILLCIFIYVLSLSI